MTVAGASAVPAALALSSACGWRRRRPLLRLRLLILRPVDELLLRLRLRLWLLLQLRLGPTGDDGFGFVLLRLTATAQCGGCGRFLLPDVTAGWGQLRARQSSLVNL